MADNVDVQALASDLDYYFRCFRESFSPELVENIDIDVFKLLDISQSYFFDLERYVRFHEIEIPDRARRASYLCKWILKTNPVFYNDSGREGSYYSKSDLEMNIRSSINESFAVFSAMSEMGFLPDILDDESWVILIYSFRYRNISEDMLILYFTDLVRRFDNLTN